MFELLPLPLQYVAAYLTLLVLVVGAAAGVIYAIRFWRNYRAADKHALNTK